MSTQRWSIGCKSSTTVTAHPHLSVSRANSATTLPESTPEDIRKERIYRRFYTALQLRDLCNEMPIHLVARKYDFPRGAVQTLSQISEGFAAGMIQFCEKMSWGMLKAALEHMSDRLKAGARADLLELAQLPFVKSRTARIFWENGFKDVRKVAEAEGKDLLPVLLLVNKASVGTPNLLIHAGTTSKASIGGRGRDEIPSEAASQGGRYHLGGEQAMGFANYFLVQCHDADERQSDSSSWKSIWTHDALFSNRTAGGQ